MRAWEVRLQPRGRPHLGAWGEVAAVHRSPERTRLGSYSSCRLRALPAQGLPGGWDRPWAALIKEHRSIQMGRGGAQGLGLDTPVSSGDLGKQATSQL